MSMSVDGSTVMNVCCHSNGYSSAVIVVMHVLNVLHKCNNQLLYRMQHKNNPLRKLKILEYDKAYFAAFLMPRYASVRHVNFIKIHKQNYGCAKCKVPFCK